MEKSQPINDGIGGSDAAEIFTGKGNTSIMLDEGIKKAQEDFERDIRAEATKVAEEETDTFLNWLNVADDVIIAHLPEDVKAAFKHIVEHEMIQASVAWVKSQGKEVVKEYPAEALELSKTERDKKYSLERSIVTTLISVVLYKIRSNSIAKVAMDKFADPAAFTTLLKRVTKKADTKKKRWRNVKKS